MTSPIAAVSAEAIEQRLARLQGLERLINLSGSDHLNAQDREVLRHAFAALRGTGRLTTERAHVAARLLQVDVREVARELGDALDEPASLEERTQIVANLRQRHEEGTLTSRHKRAAADLLGCSVRTIERDIARGAPAVRTPRRFTLDDHQQALLIEAEGRADRLHELLLAEASDPSAVPSLRTVQRAVARLAPGQRAYSRGGSKARRNHDAFARHETTFANEQWQMDSVLLPIEVIVPHHAEPIRPWLTVVQESRHREWIGLCVSVLAVTSADALAALGMAALNSGAPNSLRLDNALEFKSKAVLRAMAAIGCSVEYCDPYAPHQKGKVERLIRTIQERHCVRLPGYLVQGRDATGRRYAGTPPMTLERAVIAIEEQRAAYNNHPHGALDSMTPAQSRARDLTVSRTVTPEEARFLFRDVVKRRVQKDGIAFKRTFFTAPQLNGLVGDRVEIRFMPHDRRWINVYHAGRYLCTAFPQDMLTEDEQNALIAARRTDAQRLRELRDKARRRARVRLAPLAAGDKVEITSTTTTTEARNERQTGQRPAKGRRSTNLLDLNA